MNTYLQPGALGRFLALWKVFIQATFAYGGSEMCVIAAGETQDREYHPPATTLSRELTTLLQRAETSQKPSAESSGAS